VDYNSCRDRSHGDERDASRMTRNEELTAMEHRRPVDDYRWLWTVRPRRLGLGDLMFGVALAALGCFATVLVFRSELGDGRRAAFGLVTLLLFAMQAAQWRLGGIPIKDPRSGHHVLLGVASYLLAMAMFVLLLVLAALFPDGAALVVLALVVTAIYLSTWE
jgi:hypothetical protein